MLVHIGDRNSSSNGILRACDAEVCPAGFQCLESMALPPTSTNNHAFPWRLSAMVYILVHIGSNSIFRACDERVCPIAFQCLESMALLHTSPYNHAFPRGLLARR